MTQPQGGMVNGVKYLRNDWEYEKAVNKHTIQECARHFQTNFGLESLFRKLWEEIAAKNLME